MQIPISDEARKWQGIARQYADDYLQPHEVEAELNDGVLPDEITQRNKTRAIELGFTAIDVPKRHGGLELPMETQVAIWEQLGRVTNALSWCFPEAQSWMFEACNDEQLERYILPMMRGEQKECYAITESGPGSDVSSLEATATRDGDDYVLNGEKWYVTSGNLASFIWFQANLPDEDGEALFLVDHGTPGIEIVANPKFSHTYASHHPTYRFDNVRIPASNRVGQPGDGIAFTHSWFRHERLMIAARSCGAMARLIEEATAFANDRMLDGAPLSEKQAIQFMLADCTTELYAARLMTYDTARADDRAENLKAVHARCSMAKLFVSEAANRVADRAVQIFGGRGYMRENVAERFFRELRVDRIWEGTSEIQRLIIARSLLKRGLDGM
ncbi:MAG: acyl-CoA dehydrogenase [Chromatiales bacterium]|nr:MAG: acyl-CoA dehydrogenase [Chromatiales bacterium]